VNHPYTDPIVKVSDLIRHFLVCRERDLATSALFCLPSWTAGWTGILSACPGVRCLHVYPKGSKVYQSHGGCTPDTAWDVSVWWIGPERGPLSLRFGLVEEMQFAEESTALSWNQRMRSPYRTFDGPRRGTSLLDHWSLPGVERGLAVSATAHGMAILDTSGAGERSAAE
jgi:hypothetical protein